LQLIPHELLQVQMSSQVTMMARLGADAAHSRKSTAAIRRIAFISISFRSRLAGLGLGRREGL